MQRSPLQAMATRWHSQPHRRALRELRYRGLSAGPDSGCRPGPRCRHRRDWQLCQTELQLGTWVPGKRRGSYGTRAQLQRPNASPGRATEEGPQCIHLLTPGPRAQACSTVTPTGGGPLSAGLSRWIVRLNTSCRQLLRALLHRLLQSLLVSRPISSSTEEQANS